MKEWFDSPVINTKSWPKMQLMQMEINVVTLHKVVETMPPQMRSVIKAKGGPTKYGQAVYFIDESCSISEI